MVQKDSQMIINYLRIIILLLLLRLSPQMVDTASKIVTYFATGFDIGIAEIYDLENYDCLTFKTFYNYV